MALVYGFPPVKAVGHMWTNEIAIEASVSPITGRRFASAYQRERRMASVLVSALDAAGSMGAGYTEMLKRLLQGGENYIRLTSRPINWHIDAQAAIGSNRPLRSFTWTQGGFPVEWTSGGAVLLWELGLDGTLTTVNGLPAIVVNGLPLSALVARPGDYLTVYENAADTTGSTVMVMAPAYSNASGAATIKLYSAPAYAGRVVLGSQDTGVFKAVGELPSAMQPVAQNWTLAWQMEEVFTDEVGGFTEDNTWWEATGGV
jgi:hypothetical protein